MWEVAVGRRQPDLRGLVRQLNRRLPERLRLFGGGGLRKNGKDVVLGQELVSINIGRGNAVFTEREFVFFHCTAEAKNTLVRLHLKEFLCVCIPGKPECVCRHL